MPDVITSRQNGSVRALRAALAARRPGAVVAIEGPHLLREALAVRDGSMAVETVFLREDRRALAAEVPAGVAVVLLSKTAFASAAATEHSQGVAALLQRPERAYVARPGDLVVVAAGLQDPGNLGTLIRSAEAFGAAAVVLAEETVDPWNGKALRAAAGATFRLPLPRWTPALLGQMREAGLRLMAAVVADEGATPAHVASLREGCALLVGSEGGGLSPAMLAVADERVTLTMAGPTESLNAAVAASLLLYEASRQRAAAGRGPADLRH